jgi:hypothetical protein
MSNIAQATPPGSQARASGAHKTSNRSQTDPKQPRKSKIKLNEEQQKEVDKVFEIMKGEWSEDQAIEWCKNYNFDPVAIAPALNTFFRRRSMEGNSLQTAQD